MIRTLSPLDNSVIVERPEATAAEIDEIFERSAAVQPAYAALPLDERIAIADRFLSLLAEDAEKLGRDIALQMGRPLQYCAGEISTAVARGRWSLDAAPAALADVQGDSSAPSLQRYMRRVAKGVVLCIAAWNYPYLVTINGLLPALVAGNTVVLKHSPQTPLVAEAFVELYARAGLPEGVLQCVHVGSAEVVERLLCTRPEVAHVCFTGSVAGGTAVERAVANSNGPASATAAEGATTGGQSASTEPTAAAPKGGRGHYATVGLELGGKDAAYVRADADIAYAAEQIVDGATFNSGQSCCAIERVYVHASVHDAFLAACVDVARKTLHLGDPLATTPASADGGEGGQQVTVGPMVSAAQANFVRGQVEAAIKAGAVPHLPLSALDTVGSNFVTPQILSSVSHAMSVMTAETFGPILPIQSVASDAEAVAMMNDSVFGLTASVWSTDADGAVGAILDGLQAGTVFLNRADYPDPSLAWTGTKLSGRGTALGGVVGFEPFTYVKSYHLRRRP